MNEQPANPNVNVLKRVLGFPSLYVIAIGVVTAQSGFVSTLQGAGIGGGSFFIALIIAFCLTLCYVSTYSELSLMMPKAASISLYTAVAMGHFPAIIATLSGYLAPVIFGGPAELLLVEYVLNVAYPDVFHNVGFIILIVLTLSNLLGIDIFSSVQNFLTYSMLTAGLLLGFAGLNPNIVGGASSIELWQQFTRTETSVFSLVVLAIWAFLSLDFICPLIEESKQPEKNIPKTMFLAAFTILVLSGVTNSVLATIPRMLLGMAHKNQLPPIFKTLHPRWHTPWFGILLVSLLHTIPLLIFKNMPDALMLLVISAATCWLLTYIVAHVDVLILRKKYPHFPRPFKTPFYPIPQLLGILGMGYAFFNNAPTPEMTVKVYTNSAIFMGITAFYAFFWVRFKMKKGLFEAESLDEALKD
jgi:amino acid transporter